MTELYGNDFDSVAGGGRPFAERLRRIAGAVAFLALVGGMALWAYRLGTRDAAEVPVIQAMAGPARVQPEDPGGLRAAHQGLEVNSVLAGEPAPEAQAATPAIAPPVLLTEEDGPQGELVVASPMTLPEAELSEDGDLRMPAQEDAPEPVTPQSLVRQALGDQTPAPRDIALDDAPEIALNDAPEEDPLEAAVVATEPEGSSSTRPLRRPSDLARSPAPAAAPVPAPAPAAQASAAPAAREVSSPSRGTRLVQLGAYDSEALTRQAWQQMVARNPDLLGSKSLYVERTTANARVFYRLRVAGFENSDQTRVMCESLRTRGVDCIPVTLQ